jgi:hypothetical protein
MGQARPAAWADISPAAGLVAVGKIQPGHVQALADHLRQQVQVAAGRAHGGDDVGLAAAAGGNEILDGVGHRHGRGSLEDA